MKPKKGGKKEKSSDGSWEDEGLPQNIKSFPVMAIIMLLLLFACHATWVTSNAYSSPSIVLATNNQDGSVN